MLIEVTTDDIVNGKREKCRECPIALAFNRCMPEYQASVGVDTGSFFNHEDRLVISLAFLPEVARDFVLNFDMQKDVKPFSFEIDLSTGVKLC
jgi:hypothetical protein